MRHAILFAIARHTKIKVWVRQLGRATNRALVQRLRVTAAVFFKALPATRNFAPMPRSRNKLRSEKNEVVAESEQKRQPVCIRTANKSKQPIGSRNPSDPFDPQWKNNEVDHFLRIKICKGKEQRSNEN